MTDGTPKPLLTSLDALYPSASKVGFFMDELTGDGNDDSPHTFRHESTSHFDTQYRDIFFGVDRPGIYQECWANIDRVRLGTPDAGFQHRSVSSSISPKRISELTTCSAQGNLLLKIDGPNSNPTQTLMGAIQKRTAKQTKDEEFYLAFLEGEVRCS